jgi:hypothetical protein
LPLNWITNEAQEKRDAGRCPTAPPLAGLLTGQNISTQMPVIGDQ